MRVFVTFLVLLGCLDFVPVTAHATLRISEANSIGYSVAILCDSSITFYADQDQDGWGNAMDTVIACQAPNGYVAVFGDCDDTDNQVYPAAVEVCNNQDENCDGEADEYVMIQFYRDADLDGFGDLNNMILACVEPEGFVENTLDCDDQVMTFQDIDGDGFGSEIADACGVLITGDCDDNVLLFEDLDNDGFGGIEYAACGNLVSDDCNDSDPLISPIGLEICNSIDDNCNGEVDEGVLSEYYNDADLDGFGDINVTVYACEPATGYVGNTEDCDDNLLTYADLDFDGFGGSDLVACGVNNSDDCDDSIILYADIDGDGFGSNDMDACGVFNADDCDDFNVTINPSASEFCNGIDDNCNVEIDEGVTTTYYLDADSDGFGDINVTAESCFGIVGYVDNGFDCDDNMLLYTDADSDGYGGQTLDACGVSSNSDCLDFDDSVNPNAVELCDNIDQNCNGIVDEGVLLTFYQDLDQDGYGNLNVSIQGCGIVNGYVADSSDCDDNAAQVNPGMPEIPDNNVDENCDGQIITSISEIDMTYKMYPNPANDYLVVESSQLEIGKLFLYNVTGQEVYSCFVNGKRTSIDLSRIGDGVYFIQIGQEKMRLVVSH